VEREFLNLEVWDQFTQREARAVGEALARCLHPSWRFDGVARHEMGDQRRFVAFFDHDGSRFALIPGHEAALGYERGSFVLQGEQKDLWQRARREWGWDLGRMLDSALTPFRRVNIRPFLFETSFLWGRRQRKIPDEKNAALGFRLVNSDEWEYACGAGSRGLFRWGDDCPPGNPATHEAGYHNPPFLLHTLPNAFGLLFPHDTYAVERCAAPAGRGVVYRAGDGGGGVCGGAGHFAGWLPLLTAYEDKQDADQEQTLFVGERRAYSLRDEWLD
jgi:hypothetical protein